jgi:hypothetical protein
MYQRSLAGYHTNTSKYKIEFIRDHWQGQHLLIGIYNAITTQQQQVIYQVTEFR